MSARSARVFLVWFALLPMGASAQQWRVISFEWQDKAAYVGAGNLDVEIVHDNRSVQRDLDADYAFWQQLKLKRKAKWIQVTSCSIVENADTNGGDAGALLHENGTDLAVYMHGDTFLLMEPRVCISVIQ